jgi:hypothetical protein
MILSSGVRELEMAPPARFERAAFGFGRRRSDPAELRRRANWCRRRASNPRSRCFKPALYRLSYRGVLVLLNDWSPRPGCARKRAAFGPLLPQRPDRQAGQIERACLSATASRRPLRLPFPPRGGEESMRSGVTGWSRTDTSGITTHGSAIELRPRLSARHKIGLGGPDRTDGLVFPKHARYLLRHTELCCWWSSRVGTIHRPPPYQDGALPLSYTRWFGASCTTRTCDPWFRRPVLCIH